MKNKVANFSTHDLVMLGVFNAVLLLSFYGILMILHLLPFLWGAIDPIVNFFIAPIFLIMVLRIPKIGVLTVHGIIVGLVHAVMGWWPGFFAAFIAGLIADTTALFLGGYKKFAIITTCILIFVSFKAFLFYAPLYAFSYVPMFNKVLEKWPQSYIEKFTLYYAVGFIFFNLLSSSAGLLIGKRIVNKHFIDTKLIRSHVN